MRVLLLLLAPLAFAQNATVCAGCHPKIAASYERTAMARSFRAVASPGAVGEYFHAASNTHFSMLVRDGRYYQRRWQIGFEGREENVDEKSVDYVLGSGNHTRTFLHRTPSGALQELPLAWYAENGGTFAMNPGYDKADQPNARRKIDYECMACHNGVPSIPADHDQPRAEPLYTGALPEGIDCQRCHGSTVNHVRVAQTPGATREAIRRAIVNPARLSPDRRMEVCMQCHLETTSFPFPHSMLREGRGTFSYKPGEPLGDYAEYFDHAGDRDRFQIVSSVYRLRQSQCFLKSAGKLQCTTCHDPHDDSPKDFNAACRQCHAASHQPAGNCVDCHMPRRRTDDVVHVIMTDHLIQRRKPARDLLAAKPEPNGPETIYRGEVLPYYPAIPGEPYVAAGLRYKPGSLAALLDLEDFRRATELMPTDAFSWQMLGQSLLKAGRRDQGMQALRKSVALDPEVPEAHYALGTEDSLREAIRLQPDYAAAHQNLAVLLSQANRLPEAEYHYKVAIRLRPDYTVARNNYALMLRSTGRNAEADAVIKNSPK